MPKCIIILKDQNIYIYSTGCYTLFEFICSFLLVLLKVGQYCKLFPSDEGGVIEGGG